YDARTTQARPRLVSDAGHAPQLMGYFDRNWQLPASVGNEGGDEVPENAPATVANVPAAAANAPAAIASASLRTRVSETPAAAARLRARAAGAATRKKEKAPLPPAPPSEFSAPAATQAGKAAREIARLVPTFTNYRSTIRDASWLVDDAARWSIR